jgi:gamma-glutamyltranspeptidase/glutathione hydrolase
MSMRFLLASCVAVIGMLTSTTDGQSERPMPQRAPVVGRSKVVTKYGIVAASQPLAARAGVQILERGGNAVDAAIATNAVMTLVEPHNNGLGGDLFAIVYEARTGRLFGLNAGGWSPGGLTPALLTSRGMSQMPARGVHSVTVPGVVAGWDALRTRFGRLAFADLMAAAIFYAEDGFPVSEVTATAWGAAQDLLMQDPHAARIFLPGGRAPSAGEVFRNTDLAASFRRISEKGRVGFYEGPTAEAILGTLRGHGGTMSEADLREYEPEWVQPISTTYRGWTVSEIPPNTQGIAALMMLNLMQQFPLDTFGFHSPRALHVMIEAKKLAYADMLRYVADPRFATVPTTAMLDMERAKARAALINPAKAACNVQPSTFDGLTASPRGDTIYLAAIDREGNIVSLIQSLFNAFGSGLVAQGTGILLQNRGALFTLDASHPNVLAPRKRPLHTIIPGFMQKGDVRIGFGIMGGFNQAQAHAQFVAAIADFGFDIQQALEAGRFTKTTFTGCDVQVEELVPDDVRRELAALGHEVQAVRPRTGAFGYGQAVMSNGTGIHFGASEPRHDGAAIPEAPAVFTGRTPSSSR